MVIVKYVAPNGSTCSGTTNGIQALECLKAFVRHDIDKLELTIDGQKLSITNLLKVLKF